VRSLLGFSSTKGVSCWSEPIARPAVATPANPASPAAEVQRRRVFRWCIAVRLLDQVRAIRTELWSADWCTPAERDRIQGGIGGELRALRQDVRRVVWLHVDQDGLGLGDCLRH